ncbi:hypothetical protein CJ030_MR6G005325 [Morella rubra]|uniref:Uncharacterized protein n=1 Tax=Morella rubra TaxID=262757 RepID=A0A6A1VF88_9ROSI|nr:hypothetical protein CJ030_MR6G005325 [Morella rubra]
MLAMEFEREVEGSDDSSKSFSEDCSDSKNMTPRTKDDVMPVGGKCLQCDLSVHAEMTSRIKHGRGSTRDIAFLKARTAGKLTVHIPYGHTGGDDKASSCSQVILVRSFDSMSHFRRDDFQLDYDRPEDRITISSTMNTLYGMHSNRMFQHYLVFNSKEEALQHPYPR